MAEHKLAHLARTLEEEVRRRNALGDYSQEAAGIRLLHEGLWLVTTYIIEAEKKAKKK